MYVRVVDDDGTKHGIAADHSLHLMVLPDGEHEVFQRHAHKFGIDGSSGGKVTWLVGRLNGVNVYCIGEGRLIMTTQELNP